ncbi:hypothetical protein FIU87_05045 [Bacillus sp. THAF10]|uniref:hypothetical protein n=1 Tax=Bacillus sp. THAF10 TaxID=2587848 RepID=UPI0012A9C9F9|nr:hypothetical protein [Bacillus sp. THAF10]QFT88017.1 hypothetical protein FIU87_05045 [Bacillus sp. THAF10]
MFHRGSTAVLSTPETPFLVAVKREGIYSFEEGEWLLQYGLSQGIYKLVCLGDFIFGIGDHGTILRYDPYQKKWTHTTFPSPQRLWDITGNKDGLIVTHGGNKLFVSYNFGSSWSVIKPFRSLKTPPLIRSLFYEKDYIYIGTQVNKESGGLWRYSLQTEKLERVKSEENSMISSVFINRESNIFITKGNVQTGVGSVEGSKLGSEVWLEYNKPIKEKAFLDLFMANNRLYATTSRDEFGYSRIYEVQKKTKSLIPIETVQGHGFRGAGFQDQLFICSPVESKWIHNPYKTPTLVH